MQRLAIALAVCTFAGCTSDASEAPTNADTGTAASQPQSPVTADGKAADTVGKVDTAGIPTMAPANGAAGAAAPGNAAKLPATPPSTNAPQSSTTLPATPSQAADAADAAGANTEGPAAMQAAAMETDDAASGKKLAMDECDLHTPYAGDEYCILPPPADKGFQVHIGPSDYENPSAEYLLQPGEENVVTMNTTSGNDEQVYYYYRQYRMRPGSHHVIISGNGRRLGGTQNLAKDNPDFGDIPPENEHIGLPLEPHSDISVNMHYYNFTDKPIIREVWVNFWYKDADEVTESAREVFSPAGVSAAVAHSHVVVGASCPVTGEGRLLTLYGHRHLNNVRFSVFRNRGGERQLVLEDYNSEHPSVFEFNSLTTNEMPDPMLKRPGAYSGMLDIMPGDSIDFECEIINMTDKNFTGANEAQDDEMCILVGDAVGAGLQPFCTPMQAQQIK